MVPCQPQSRVDRKVVAALLIFQALFFYHYYCREIAWDVPENNDQTDFLMQSYGIQENVLNHGIGVLWRSLGDPRWRTGNGWLYPWEGAIPAILFGGGRMPRLAVNFIAFAVLQWVAFHTARRVWGRRVYAYALLGLILAENSPWFFAGGLFDFRMDFPAYCLYGIWACAVLRSGMFLERRWAVAAGLIGALLALNRYIASVYMMGAWGLFGIVLLVAWWRARGPARREEAQRRVGNIILATAILLAIVVPAFLFNRHLIYLYYIVGHVTSGEKYIRLRGTGIVDAASYLLYYPKNVLFDHLGRPFEFAAPIGLITAVVLRIVGRRGGSAAAATPWLKNPVLLQLSFLICAILIPLAALTSDISKSPVVGSIVDIPVALLVVQIIAALTENLPEALYPILCVATVVMFGIGANKILDNGTKHSTAYTYKPAIEHLVAADDWMAKFAVEHDWPQPKLSCDAISGWFNNGVINCLAYEHSSAILDFRLLLGDTINKISEAAAMEDLAESDFVILSDPYRISGYPFTEGIAEYWPDIKSWCDQNLVHVQTFKFINQSLILYVRPTAVMEGMISEWIPARGIDLIVPTETLSRFPVINITGQGNPALVMSAAATDQSARGPHPLPTKLVFTGQSYELRIDSSGIDLNGTESAHIHVDFAINVPAVPDQGIIPKPDRVALVREKP